MISFKQKGDFANLTRFLEKAKNGVRIGDLDKYGITNKQGSVRISFNNTNIQNGVPIAIILQYGHGTRNGGWVEGRDYINPAIQPIFDEIVNSAWREVIKA